MRPLLKIDAKKFFEIIKKSQKVFWYLGRHIFFVILILIAFDLLFGSFVFYKYVSLVKQQEPVVSGNFKFEYAAYQEIVSAQAKREAFFNEISEEKYSDPFSPP